MQSLDNNTQAFLALVRAGLWETDIQLSPYGEVDFKEVYRLAQEQSVVGLVAAGLEHVVDIKVPKDTALLFAGEALQLEQRNSAMNYFIAELVDKMQSASIKTLLIKGQGVAQCYERPLWRSCGDVDYLLDKDNYDKAKNYLLPLADTVNDENENCRHQAITINPWVVEIHGSLHTELSLRIDKKLDAILNDLFLKDDTRIWKVEKKEVQLPGIMPDILFVFTHFLKHFYKGGLGLRQICDWCRLLWRFNGYVDSLLLEEHLIEMQLLTEWHAFAAYAVEYLGMPKEKMPLYSNDIKWGKKAKRINEFLIRVGNLGNNRNTSYYNYPFVVRKACSFGRRISDILHHASIFPYDSWRFLISISTNGIRSALKGIG